MKPLFTRSLSALLLFFSASSVSADFANTYGQNHAIPPLQVMAENEEILNRFLAEFELPEAHRFDAERNLIAAAFTQEGLLEQVIFLGRSGRVDYIGKKPGVLSARCLTNVDAFGDLADREFEVSSLGFFELKQNETDTFAVLLPDTYAFTSKSLTGDGLYQLPANGLACQVPRFISYELSTEVRAIRPAK